MDHSWGRVKGLIKKRFSLSVYEQLLSVLKSKICNRYQMSNSPYFFHEEKILILLFPNILHRFPARFFLSIVFFIEEVKLLIVYLY